MWIYQSSDGALFHDSTENLVCRGYSGHGAGLNNPSMENVPDIGPIPKGLYCISSFFDDAEKGPIVAHLTPWNGTDTFGRSGFMIHGDNPQGNNTASHGCIILSHNNRVLIRDSKETTLRII